jgi:DNA modification methylase
MVLVLRGDARSLPLPDASVDLIVTSPPFWALRSYTDGGVHYDGQIGAEQTPAAYVDSLIACTAEWVRVLKPAGSLWVNLGDKYNSAASGQNGTGATPARGPKMYRAERGRETAVVRPKSLIGLPWRYALRCIDDLGLTLRAEVIWSKPNGQPESVTDRVRRSHEQWFHLVREPRYFSAVDEIREPHSDHTLRYYGPGTEAQPRPTQQAQKHDGKDGAPRIQNRLTTVGALGKLPGSVWTIATEPLSVPEHLGIDHFAAFPTEWPRRIILGWSPVGGVVLDPFGGTGTTALVAKALGRIGISVDYSADYCRLAQWRTTDRRELAKAMRVPKPEPVAEEQLSLDLAVA